MSIIRHFPISGESISSSLIMDDSVFIEPFLDRLFGLIQHLIEGFVPSAAFPDQAALRRKASSGNIV